MLEVIDGSFTVKQRKSVKAATRENTVMNYLNDNGEITNSDVRKLLNVSVATANRILNTMVEKGLIIRFRNGKSWAYRKR